jgi:hypothetical protein
MPTQWCFFLYSRKYEVLLRSYEGNDPLEPWYEYILWVEQSFLRDGREGNLNTLLHRCLTHFKEDERYFQDRRYIELWIKYVSKCQMLGSVQDQVILCEIFWEQSGGGAVTSISVFLASSHCIILSTLITLPSDII